MEDIYSSKERRKSAQNQSNQAASPTNSEINNDNQDEKSAYSEYQINARRAAEEEFERAQSEIYSSDYNYNNYQRESEPRDVYASSYSKNNASSFSNLPQQPQQDFEEVDTRRPRKKRKGILKKIILSVISLVLVFVIGLGVVINQLLSSVEYNQSGHKKNIYVDESKLHSDLRVTNILLVGVDRRQDDVSSRSDTLMLLSIDKVNKKIKMTSFLRDSWVDIPGKKYAKLNAASTWGGMQLVMDTLEYNFNVQIDHYVMVDFKMFQDIVNKLGGVDVEITEKEAKYMRDVVHLKNIKAGESVHLNGGEALWYCRIRYLDTDFKRTERQRKVMTSLINKAKKQSPTKIIQIAREVLPDIETDMTKKEIASLGIGTILKYIRYDMKQASIPKDGTWKNARKNGQAVLEMDISENQKYLYDFIYGKDKEEETTKSN